VVKKTFLAAAAPRAVVLGRIGYDLYSQEPSIPLDQVRRFRAGLGGSSANIAVGLSRLGWRVTMLSAVSDDAVGRFVTSALAAEGVDVTAVQAVRGHNTSLALTEVVPPLGAEQVFYRCRPADAELAWSGRVSAAVGRGGAPAGSPAIFLTNGTTLCTPRSRAVTVRALRAARAAGMTTVIDVDYRASSWRSTAAAGAAARAIWPWVDILLANDGEMRMLAPSPGRAGGAAHVAAAALRRGIQIVVWKRGADGSVAFTAEGQFRAAAAPVTVVSTNGAGDGFASGFLAAYGHGLPVAECLRHGSAAAGCVVGRVECAAAMPRPAELTRSLKAMTVASGSPTKSSTPRWPRN